MPMIMAVILWSLDFLMLICFYNGLSGTDNSDNRYQLVTATRMGVF